jgi:2-oxoglutarate ferredoxin oxidoreductase subunit beta
MNAPVVAEEREKLTKKALTADHPTWCPGCGDFAVLAAFYKVLEKRQFQHERVVSLAGIGCASRFLFAVQGSSFLTVAPAHSLGREPLPARPACVSLRGDGDGFSIKSRGPARKNIRRPT